MGCCLDDDRAPDMMMFRQTLVSATRMGKIMVGAEI